MIGGFGTIVGSPPLPRCETLMPKMERGFLLKRFKLKSLSSQPAPGGRAIMGENDGGGPHDANSSELFS